MIGKLQELFGLGTAQTLGSVVGIFATIMMLVALVITVYSGYDYLAKNKDVLKLEDC